MIRLLLLAWAALFIAVPPARASTADSLRTLCGSRAVDLAPLVQATARRFLLHPQFLASVIAAESTCRPRAIGARGEIGLGQIKPDGSAAAGYTRAQLFDPATNLEATARHLARLHVLCGSFAGALSVYSGRRKCRPSTYSRHVLGLLRAAERKS